jgi:hypothetical protein
MRTFQFLGALVTAGALLSACSAPSAPAASAPSTKAGDLNAIKTYLTGKSAALVAETDKLQSLSNEYYALAKANNFDHAAVFASDKTRTIKLVEDMRASWRAASPLYEQMEGIVAGTPTLESFDVILDAGASKEEGGDGVVPFDLKLPDGRTLEKPGNLFGVSESTLWGTYDAFKAPGQFDFNGDGAIAFGEALPDANVLKGAVDTLSDNAKALQSAAGAWEPTEKDAFNALVVMVPTMSEYFDSWKSSRFVAGDASTQRDFVAVSRLADIGDILGSLEVVRSGLSPRMSGADSATDAQIAKNLSELKSFVADVHAKETAGKRFTAEEADTLGAEAQNRATAIVGQVTQVAAKLGVKTE